MEGLINEYSRGGAYLRQYPMVVARMFLCALIQLTALFLVPYFSCRALGIEAVPGRFLAMQAILSLAVTAVPLPGSVGASEGSFISLYRPILGGGTCLPGDDAQPWNQLLCASCCQRRGHGRAAG